MKQFFLSIIIFLFAIALGIYSYSNISGYPDKINTWATEHNIKIKKIEHQYWDYGPYSRWTSKNRSIYKVETSNGVYWFRFNHISSEINEVEKE